MVRSLAAIPDRIACEQVGISHESGGAESANNRDGEVHEQGVATAVPQAKAEGVVERRSSVSHKPSCRSRRRQGRK